MSKPKTQVRHLEHSTEPLVADTPRTDACSLGRIQDAYERHGLRNCEVCDADHARQLEREADTLKAENLKLRKALTQIAFGLHYPLNSASEKQAVEIARTALGSKT